jgi:hypothetical protein
MGWFGNTKKKGKPSESIAENEKNNPQVPAAPTNSASGVNELNDILPVALFESSYDPTSSHLPREFATQVLGNDSPLHYSSFDSDSRSTASNLKRDIQCEVLAEWLHAKAEEKLWTAGKPGEGVFVKKTKGNYSVSPAELATDGTRLYQAINVLNVRVCLLSHCSS